MDYIYFTFHFYNIYHIFCFLTVSQFEFAILSSTTDGEKEILGRYLYR